MNVARLMTRRVSWVGPDATLPEIARRMRAEDIGCVPVAHNDRLIGMVTDRDMILRAVAEGGEIERRTAREVMTDRVLYCFEDETIAAVLRTMADRQVRRLPVVSRAKRLVGVVSLGDLAHAAGEKAGDALKAISQPTRVPVSAPARARPPLDPAIPRH
jgi:CBS domain-containing protein